MRLYAKQRVAAAGWQSIGRLPRHTPSQLRSGDPINPYQAQLRAAANAALKVALGRITAAHSSGLARK